MKKDDRVMQSWVKEKDIVDNIVPEINRIWHNSRISFRVERILESKVLNPPNKEDLIMYIVNSHRDDSGHLDTVRSNKLRELIDWKNILRKQLIFT